MEPETVKRYRLRPTALASEQERGTRLILPLMLTGVSGIAIVAFGNGWHKLSVGSIVFLSGLITVYALYALIVVPKKIRARLARCWPTYELEIGPAYLLRRQIDLADLKLEFTEIKKAVHTPGR